MIVTIDGPAGAGKSSVARALAERLGFRFLDTGAMYRAVAWAAQQHRVDLHDVQAVSDLAGSIRLRLDQDRVYVDQQDVTQAIRSAEVTGVVHFVADNPRVRALLRAAQRDFARHGSLVTEGRDQGTDVFPDAECKIFLTASPQERARRRLQQLHAQGQSASLSSILKQQNARDERDATRAVGKLTPAVDAIHVVTDAMTYQQVLEQLESLVRQRLAQRSPGV